MPPIPDAIASVEWKESFATSNQEPAHEIVMVHFVNEAIMSSIQNGKTPLTISAHEQVLYYGITSVNVAREVSLAIKNGKYTWKDYGGVHPKSFGYSIASEMIAITIAGGWERSNREPNCLSPSTSTAMPTDNSFLSNRPEPPAHGRLAK